MAEYITERYSQVEESVSVKYHLDRGNNTQVMIAVDVDDVITDPYLKYTHTNALGHTLAVLFFATVGLFGNGLIIYIYQNSKAKNGSVYMRILAVIDMVTLCVILPIFPFIQYFLRYSASLYILLYGSLVVNTTFLHMWVMQAMTVERTVAVFKPFKIKYWRRPIQRIMFTLAVTHVVWNILSIFNFTIINTSPSMKRHVLGIIGNFISKAAFKVNLWLSILSVVTLFSAYAAVIIKLYCHGNTMNKLKKKRYKVGERSPANNVTDDDDATIKLESPHTTIAVAASR